MAFWISVRRLIPISRSPPQMTTRAPIAMAALPRSSAVENPPGSSSTSSIRCQNTRKRSEMLSKLPPVLSLFSNSMKSEYDTWNRSEDEEQHHGSQLGDDRYEHRRPPPGGRLLQVLPAVVADVLAERKQRRRHVHAALGPRRQQLVG